MSRHKRKTYHPIIYLSFLRERVSNLRMELSTLSPISTKHLGIIYFFPRNLFTESLYKYNIRICKYFCEIQK